MTASDKRVSVILGGSWRGDWPEVVEVVRREKAVGGVPHASAKEYVKRRKCRDFGGEEGTNGEMYDFACSACGFCSCVTEPNFCPNCGAEVINE